mmetsp:Transcript_11852/g.38989  ORF Transcript_11852/g.38989 Transcript_11852/m.38989 type:complete len:253 (+) Transcript_11852:399-1157(+)
MGCLKSAEGWGDESVGSDSAVMLPRRGTERLWPGATVLPRRCCTKLRPSREGPAESFRISPRLCGRAGAAERTVARWSRITSSQTAPSTASTSAFSSSVSSGFSGGGGSGGGGACGGGAFGGGGGTCGGGAFGGSDGACGGGVRSSSHSFSCAIIVVCCSSSIAGERMEGVSSVEKRTRVADFGRDGLSAPFVAPSSTSGSSGFLRALLKLLPRPLAAPRPLTPLPRPLVPAPRTFLVSAWLPTDALSADSS